MRGQGRLSVGRLRAIRQTFADESIERPSSTTQPSETFYSRMVDSLQKHLEAVTSPTPVSVRLKMVKRVCQVTLVGEEDEIIQDIVFEFTADLISLLRWPMSRGGPIFTESGEYVTWSVFDDINYGELDFVRPYVTYTAARKIPEEIPKRVSQFFDESEELTVSLAHDISVCPFALGEGGDHDECWRIILPSMCPTPVRKQLDRPLTGEEVNGLLAPGKFYAGRLYTFDIKPPTVSERDESIVFHEERYIRMLLRDLGVSLKQLTPGTFLQVADQQWLVSIEWDGRYFRWQAQSVVSGLFFRGEQQTIELVSINNAQEECKRLLSTITSQIPQKQIFDYPKLENQVLADLKRRGYSESSPPCEIKILQQSRSVCQYGVFLVDGFRREPLFTATIDATEVRDASIVMTDLTEGLDSEEMSGFNIKNKDAFLKRLSTWVNKHIQDTEL